MTINKATVDRYMEGFRKGDHQQILSCLTEDVEWLIPGMFHIHGKAAFDKEIENDQFTGKPSITVTRMTEENDVVVAEGIVRAQRATGEMLTLAMCDVFELHDGRIRRLVSYLMPMNEAG
jgi:ketosteroid isomerase-like protein